MSSPRGIYKHTLKNGLTILCWPQHQIPKVSVQIWYDVGSKDEGPHQKGIAHLLEHMVFKGTEKLSESDINLITHKLSGYSNAFTSHDYTGYVFDFPSQHWQHALPIFADCMVNCTFKEDMLNAELKAVIQELKMYNDDYVSTLLEKLLGAIFHDHPYHYPVIGYKKDLWSLERGALVDFYRKHYVPNNATLVVVGDVDPDDVFEQAGKAFSPIPERQDYKRAHYYHSSDTVSQKVTLYRDVQQPIAMMAWVITGTKEKKDYLLDVISWIIGSGKGSRLNRLIVEQLELATQIESFVYDLSDYGLFVITYQPRETTDIPLIVDLVNKELEKIAENGCTESELKRACKKTEMDFISMTEDPERCAYLLGKHYLATQDENYLLHYNDESCDINAQIKDFTHRYLRQSSMHQGVILSLPEKEKHLWTDLQKRSDEEDVRVLSRVARETKVEEGVFVKQVAASEQMPFVFPHPNRFTLSNGLEVMYYHDPRLPKIDAILEFKARGYYDPVDKQGLMTFLMDVIQEGTANYPGHRYSEELESHGMTLNASSGQISITSLSHDFQMSMALLAELVTNAEFKPAAIERVRKRILSDIKDFWDSPSQFVGQLARNAVYGQHPYHKSYLGTKESIDDISKKDLVDHYSYFLSPQGATLAIVGNLDKFDLQEILETAVASWKGPVVSELVLPPLESIAAAEIIYRINRDQIVLAFAGISVSRTDPDYDKLLLFDQVLTGGVLGSSASRLFQIREQTGLFYTAGGSLVTGSHFAPGMVFIKTIISPEKLAEAERLIGEVINRKADDLTEIELAEAKRALTHALIDNFSTNRSIAASFLFLNKFKRQPDYFATRAREINQISLEEVKEAVARHLNVDKMARIKIGRL